MRKRNPLIKTMIDSLDIITAGPIPLPNPSEFLMTDRMTQLIDSLKQKYDYIVLDTSNFQQIPELLKYADATIYMIRWIIIKKDVAFNQWINT